MSRSARYLALALGLSASLPAIGAEDKPVEIVPTETTVSVAPEYEAMRRSLRQAAIEARQTKTEITQTDESRMPVGTLALGAGMGATRGASSTALSLELSCRVSGVEPLYAGVLGTYVPWDLGAAGRDNMFLILPSLVYRFTRPKGSVLHPYAGVAAGVTISSLEGAAGAESRTRAAFFFRPGAEIGHDFRIGIDGQFGLVGPDFMFLPRLSLTLAF